LITLSPSSEFGYFVPMLYTVGAFISAAKSDLLLLYNSSECQQIILLLLEDVKGYSKSDVNSHINDELTDEEWKKLFLYLEDLMLGKPVQYVLGHAWFSGMKFMVNENVLIPRPETEELCEWILAEADLKKENSILDIGTGSGCIAVALKKKWPEAKVSALDISEGALQVARQNAQLNNTDITFLKGDILLKRYFEVAQTKFDIIVSNPPYVRKTEMVGMNASVKNYEPHLALFVEGEDPLIFYSAIADFAKQRLNSNGKLFFEINQEFGEQVVKLLKEKDFSKVELRKDMSGNDRMICAAMNSHMKHIGT
jgi:release factor glutamine methyltransferase